MDDHSERLGDTRFDRFAALVVLTLFGVTWPILDLLGRNAEFFLARRSPKGEIVVLALLSIVVIPVTVALLGSLPGRVGRWIGLGLIGVTSASLAHLYLARTALPWWLDVALAVAVGAGLVISFVNFTAVRQAARYLMYAPVVVLGVFLLAMPVGDVLREPDAAIGNPIAVTNPVPVVMIVFDEFPLASIIDGEGELRADRYPNFARLAADGTWFRNAVTVEQQTEHSVPAMLTGSVPDQELIPVAGQYPFNLFTALRSVYDLDVHESITQLCPLALCEGTTASATSLVRDVSVIAGHVLLPEPLTTNLPDIDRGWGDFQTVADGDFDARAEFRELLAQGQTATVDRIVEDIEGYDPDGTGRPPLFYAHAIVPHHPWQFLPDGRSYPFIVEANPSSIDGGWNDDEFLVAQSLQRHLLQVGFVDHALGRIMAALEEAGIYDESMIVVVADHGITIKPGTDHQRTITDETVGSIAAIPLFVKVPDGTGGVVDDRRALTIDILPTIADVLGARLPGSVEGVSLFDEPADRNYTTTVGPEGAVTFGVSGHEKLNVARYIESIFPDGDPWELRPEDSPDLAGQTVDEDTVVSSDLRVQIREAELYEDVDVDDDVIPARIGGIVSGGGDGDEVLAVSVNGVIGAVTRTYRDEGTISFLAMVPPELFVDGLNDIDIYEVTAEGDLEHIAGA